MFSLQFRTYREHLISLLTLLMQFVLKSSGTVPPKFYTISCKNVWQIYPFSASKTEKKRLYLSGDLAQDWIHSDKLKIVRIWTLLCAD